MTTTATTAGAAGWGSEFHPGRQPSRCRSTEQAATPGPITRRTSDGVCASLLATVIQSLTSTASSRDRRSRARARRLTPIMARQHRSSLSTSTRPPPSSASALKDGAYVAIGLGVLGFQRAQVQRVELTKQLEGWLGPAGDSGRRDGSRRAEAAVRAGRPAERPRRAGRRGPGTGPGARPPVHRRQPGRGGASSRLPGPS